jgi:trimethylamine--corrinoid protein Co-methyltransferase
MAALAGANLIYGAGMIESGVTFDCGQLVMDNEFARMIKHVVGGITVDDETLAVEDIAAVGPFGDFLSLDATLKHMRELSQPEVLDRRVREDWEERGSRDLYATCREKARDIIREHVPLQVPADVAARVHAIVEETDRAAGVA